MSPPVPRLVCHSHIKRTHTVVILYDWIINIPREVGLFWSGDARTLSAALYFANRSVSLAMAVLEAVGLGSWSDEVRAFEIQM